MKQQAIITIGSIPVYWDGQALRFTAGFTVDCDGAAHTYHPDNIGLDALQNAKTKSGKWVGVVTANGVPVVADDGYYISTTAYTRPKYRVDDRKRYLDAITIPFIAIPPQFRKIVKDIVLGCRVVVTNTTNGATCEAMVGDIGPTFHLGEGSVALAKELGLNPDPRKGGTAKKIIDYAIFPGQSVTIHGETMRLIPRT